jgi:cytochrome c2
MPRILLTSIVAIGLALAALHTPASGGGWAVATLDDWPAQVIADQPFTISFSLRQHGLRLMSGQRGSVVFMEEATPGAAPLRFDVQPAPGEGRYTATITLPHPGRWTWQIEAFGPHAMPPLLVHAAGQQSDPLQHATMGQVLFVAKGCSGCHAHPALPAGRSSRIGPPLPNGQFTAAYLRQWLSDPKAVRPMTLMPNLGLKQSEVEALTAFLTASQD